MENPFVQGRMMIACDGTCNRILPAFRAGVDYHSDCNTVKWMSDPYAEEICGIDKKVWYCYDCAVDSAMDI
jgi:hypothetical protein